MENAIEIFFLMYADNILLSGDTVLELQRNVRVLEEFCEKWGMEVNPAKKSYCFQERGSHVQIGDILLRRGKSQDSYYGYLGLIFSSRNLWSKALSTLAAQAEKALSIVRRMV